MSSSIGAGHYARRRQDESQILLRLSFLNFPAFCAINYILMRFPSFPSLVRTLYTIANATAALRAQQPYRALGPLHRPFILRSMPSIPFFGSLFSSTPASAKMTYPDQRSDGEWQAVLNKGMSALYPPFRRMILTYLSDRAIPHPSREGY